MPTATARSQALRDEAARIDAEWLKVDKRRRDELLAFATRWSFGIAECYEPAEVDAMTTEDLRFTIGLEVDMAGENLGNRAAWLEEAGE